MQLLGCSRTQRSLQASGGEENCNNIKFHSSFFSLLCFIKKTQDKFPQYTSSSDVPLKTNLKLMKILNFHRTEIAGA